ncbi:tRNA pseudouridine(38/39) synthase-like [Stylophora pistillata]|uniref:tRNA pseudouridine(38/39) synthase n=1 Tax=Stylophora pistillata TaxID=50429 RepID=A0A2B4S4S3_STYPI|nr:tRNA pseudouridine(38/39) synthase-like [Stylophora pistillata]PFX23558.1 tRNA pseudouridine(38/39) synthase [Stylophora pistillata]
MDCGEHVVLDETAELQFLSREDLIQRVVKLTTEKEEILLKLHGSSLVEQKPDTKNAFVKDYKNSADHGKNFKKSKASTGNTSEQKPFDFSRYHKRHVALKIAYLGWDFHGFASQESTENTIEGHLFAALLKACLVVNRASSNYARCGRTDKGVSAFSQVVSLDVRSNLAEGLGVIVSGDTEKVQQRIETAKEMSEISYAHVLNKLLPPEIRIIAWMPVEQEFDARFSCLHRTYKYFFPAANLDIEIMNCAAQKFVGKHDFRNFCKMDVASGVLTFERELLSVTVEKNDSDNCSGYEMCQITICGSAFLWHQVRCMVAVLLMIGQNLENKEVIDWMLDIKQCPSRPQYNMASEVPLVLYDCCYEQMSWKHECGTLEALLKDFQTLWTRQAIKTTILSKFTEKLDDAAVIKCDDRSSVGGVCDRSNIAGERDRDKIVLWRDMRQPQFHQLMSLVPFQIKNKAHTPLNKRARHESFESKLEVVNAKRRKAGKEEFTENASELTIME